MKKALVIFILLSTIVLSQSTFNYVSERIIQKDNYTNITVDESYSPVYITVVLYQDDAGYITFSSGAFLTLGVYAGGYNDTWYWNAYDKNGSRCNVEINTKTEESHGIVYMGIKYKDYSFYYKLRSN